MLLLWFINRPASCFTFENDGDSDYDLDLDSYQPIRPVFSEHEVMIVTPKMAALSQHQLQCMHHGSTVVHVDNDSSRSCMCYLRLEIDNATLSWHRPAWSSLVGNTWSYPDYGQRGESDSASSQVLCSRSVMNRQIQYKYPHQLVQISMTSTISLLQKILLINSNLLNSWKSDVFLYG